MGNSLQVHTFKKSGELVGSIPIDLNATTFYIMPSDEMWFYSSYNMVAGDHRLFVTDGDGKVKKKLLPNDFNDKMLPIGEQSFFEGNEAVLFRESFKTSVYELSKGDSLRELYRFNFGATTVPEKYWEMDAFAGFEMISKQGFSDLSHLFDTEKYFIAIVATQKERDRKKELYIWNKSTNKEFKIEIDEDEQGYFSTPIGIEGNQLVFIAYSPYLVSNSENLNLSDEAKASLSNLTEDSNPVIIYARIPE
ncbi:6-bladed beta-propeller protein [Algoriphagus antarcticus]|uniref:6-bladed beta-propeller protein n=2 Tax=Algoriphagus antarcticus TaxID=238540 RepID=A0A3E0EBP1_9BACT|nr:6-bladed beta-propeller protein [Algoriphagus antarcticus]